MVTNVILILDMIDCKYGIYQRCLSNEEDQQTLHVIPSEHFKTFQNIFIYLVSLTIL